MILYSFAIILLLLLSSYGIYANSARAKGKFGEKRVNAVLERLPEEYTVLSDVVMFSTKGTTQIDHIVVSKHGIFAIETKNYRGEIYGNDDQEKWTQIIKTDVRYRRKWYKVYTHIKKSQFYNPVRQSLGHVYQIRKYLSEFPMLPIFSVVVFAGDASLKGVKSSHHVIYLSQLYDFITRCQGTYITDDQLQFIITSLQNCNVREHVEDSFHARNVYKKVQEKEQAIKAGICPRCGKPLVKKNGKYGRFLGCTNYPTCRFTQNL